MGYPMDYMYEGISRAEQNLLLLQSVIPDHEHFYVWCYQLSGDFVASSCPDALRKILDLAFRRLGGMKSALRLAQSPDRDQPRIIGSSVGIQWGYSLEERGEGKLLFVCGPVFYGMPDIWELKRELYRKESEQGKGEPGDGNGETDLGWIAPFCEAVTGVPVMAYSVFSRYVLMVHNTLTGRQLGLETLRGEQREAPGENMEEKNRAESALSRNRIGVYQAEQALMEMVRSGNINYQKAFHNSASLSPGVPVEGKDPLRQMKISLTVFTSLVCRAAMEGGLSPEIAYPLGDSYIQTIENSRDSGELNALAHAMYHDFIYRVHYLKSNPNYSHAIQKCCDYIELSLDRKIRVADLAALAGYTEYYLTEKFRKETGQSVSSYIRDARISRAKVLLRTTDLSVEEIAARLAFGTTSYFIQSFRSVTGLTPARYRKSV